jgi:hypothetical protein
MPDTEILDIPLSGIPPSPRLWRTRNPDLQLPLNSGKLTHYLIVILEEKELGERFGQA